MDTDFCITAASVMSEAVFLILEHSSLREVKQKKHEKKFRIIQTKLIA